MAQSTGGIAGIAFQLLLVLCLSTCIYSLYAIIYNIFFHPLASFKGPLIAKFSHAYTILWELRANRVHGVHKLLQTYGSPVRISPNELAFSDDKAFFDMYGQQADPLPKDAMYGLFTVNGSVNVLNARTRKEHAPLRRLLAHTFSAKGLRPSEDMVATRVRDFVDMTFGSRQSTVDGPVDIYSKTCSHFLDIISLLTFGKSLDTLHGCNGSALLAVQSFTVIVPTTSMVPALRYLPIRSIQEGLHNLANLKAIARENLAAYIEHHAFSGADLNRQTFLYNLVNAEDPETGVKLSMDELVDHAVIFLVAGTDTTANTVTYVLWECGRRPDVRAKVIEEIREAFPDEEIMPTYEKAAGLPFLRCVIDETLRLWGPLSTARQQRTSLGRVIGEHYVPAGTTVLGSLYSMARDPSTFPDANKFVPERWENASLKMRSMSKPFSIGSRNCVGKHLAELNFVLTLARIYQLFDVIVDECMTEDMMQTSDHGVLGPRACKLFVKCQARAAR